MILKKHSLVFALTSGCGSAAVSFSNFFGGSFLTSFFFFSHLSSRILPINIYDSSVLGLYAVNASSSFFLSSFLSLSDNVLWHPVIVILLYM
jgi:hypothetical protein